MTGHRGEKPRRISGKAEFLCRGLPQGATPFQHDNTAVRHKLLGGCGDLSLAADLVLLDKQLHKDAPMLGNIFRYLPQIREDIGGQLVDTDNLRRLRVSFFSSIWNNSCLAVHPYRTISDQGR